MCEHFIKEGEYEIVKLPPKATGGWFESEEYISTGYSSSEDESADDEGLGVKRERGNSDEDMDIHPIDDDHMDGYPVLENYRDKLRKRKIAHTSTTNWPPMF